MCVLKASPPSYQRGAFLQGHGNLKTLTRPSSPSTRQGSPRLLSRSEAGELAQPRGKGANCGWAPGEAQLPQNLLEDSPEASLQLLAKLGGLGFPSSAWLRRAGQLDLGPRGRDKMGSKRKRERGNVDFISVPTPVFIN